MLKDFQLDLVATGSKILNEANDANIAQLFIRGSISLLAAQPIINSSSDEVIAITEIMKLVAMFSLNEEPEKYTDAQKMVSDFMKKWVGILESELLLRQTLVNQEEGE